MSEFPYPYDVIFPTVKVPPPKRQFALTAQSLGIPLGVLAGCFAVSNVAVFPVSENFGSAVLVELWLAVGLGLIGAEAGLLSIGGVLGPGNGLRRLLFVLTLTLMWISGWLLGYGVTRWGDNSLYLGWKEVIASILVIPGIYCASGLPLWILRALFRWRVERPSQDGIQQTRHHLSIAGMLAVTGVVALALASMRLGRSYLGDETSDAEWWMGSGVALAFTAGISLVTLPMCTWATLRCPTLPLGIIATVAWLLVVALVLVCVISVTFGQWPRPDFWKSFLGIVFGFASGLLGTLSLVRAGGYRLFWGRESSPATLTASASTAPSAIPPAPQP